MTHRRGTLELQLAGRITTNMQASCQMGDYVSLKTLNKGTASEVAQAQFSWPKCHQQLHLWWVGGGWGECSLFTFRVVTPFWLVLYSCHTDLWAHWRRQLTNILLGKGRVVPPRYSFSSWELLHGVSELTSLQMARTMTGCCPTCLMWLFLLEKGKKGSRTLISWWVYQRISGTWT